MRCNFMQNDVIASNSLLVTYVKSACGVRRATMVDVILCSFPKGTLSDTRVRNDTAGADSCGDQGSLSA